MKGASLAILLLTTMYPSATAFAQTAQTDRGQKEYEAQCSLCHGMDAKGDGVFNQVLKVVPPDRANQKEWWSISSRAHQQRDRRASGDRQSWSA